MRINTKYKIGQRVYTTATVRRWCPACKACTALVGLEPRAGTIERIEIAVRDDDGRREITVLYYLTNACKAEAEVFATRADANAAIIKAKGL